ncbi:MAG: hypothetical protein WBM47_01180 [Polyangiales bacterium]
MQEPLRDPPSSGKQRLIPDLARPGRARYPGVPEMRSLVSFHVVVGAAAILFSSTLGFGSIRTATAARGYSRTHTVS